MDKFEQTYLNIVSEDKHYEFEYRLLDRLKQDCKYFLGHGNRCEKHLWAGDVDSQIKKMKELWKMVPEKPEWLSFDEILEYEKAMKDPEYKISKRIINEDSGKTIVLYDSSVDNYDKDEVAEYLREDLIDEPDEDDIYEYIQDSKQIEYQDFEELLECIDEDIEGHIVAVADVGRWNGTKFGIKELRSIRDLFDVFQNVDDVKVFLEDGELKAEGYHHDGTNYVTFREILPEYYYEDIEEVFYDKQDNAKEEILTKYTKPIGEYFENAL
jgi:hypothetical protein